MGDAELGACRSEERTWGKPHCPTAIEMSRDRRHLPGSFVIFRQPSCLRTCGVAYRPVALVACPDCKGEVSSEAWACPKCGKPIRVRKNLRNAIIMWGLLIVMFLVIWQFLGPRK
jgi:hypothetical protein